MQRFISTSKYHELTNHLIVLLTTYIRIDVPVAVLENLNEAGPPKKTRGYQIAAFQFQDQRREISYIMRNDTKDPGGSSKTFLKSEQFMGILDMKYISIPRHGVEFFLLLLEDVEAKWMQLVQSAKSHLATVVSDLYT